MSITLKLCGNKANGIMQQAKRLTLEEATASVAKKHAGKAAIINTCLTAANGGLTAVNACGGKVGLGIFSGLCTAIGGLFTGLQLKEFIKASKAKKQASETLNEIINKPEFKDIIQRYASMKGKGMSVKEFIQAVREKSKDGINIAVK